MSTTMQKIKQTSATTSISMSEIYRRAGYTFGGTPLDINLNDSEVLKAGHYDSASSMTFSSYQNTTLMTVGQYSYYPTYGLIVGYINIGSIVEDTLLSGSGGWTWDSPDEDVKIVDLYSSSGVLRFKVVDEDNGSNLSSNSYTTWASLIFEDASGNSETANKSDSSWSSASKRYDWSSPKGTDCIGTTVGAKRYIKIT